MRSIKMFFVFLCVMALGFSTYNGCGSEPPKNDEKPASNNNNNSGGSSEATGETEGTNSDGGTGGADSVAKEEGPKEAGAPITGTWKPADGAEIGVKDCVSITFSREPSQSKSKRSAEMVQDGSSSPIAVDFTLTGTEGKICAFSLLFYGTKYKVSYKITDPDDKTKEYTGEASFTTEKAPAGGKPLAVGAGVNLKLKGLKAPVALQSLLGSVSADQIPPIILTLHSRDDAAKGALTYVGGLGKAPSGGKPHQGKDVIDTDTPVSLALDGTFDSDSFYVGPTNFILSIAGFNLQLEDLRITGTFTADGKSIKTAILEGVIDPDLIKQQFGLDACATLLRDDCYKNKDGKDRVRIVGELEGIENPLKFSAFMTSPLYLQQGILTTSKLDIYFNQEVKDEDVTLTFSTCTGSSKEADKPCDTKEGAKVTPVKVEGAFAIDSTKKFGQFTAKSGFQATTWYKVDLTAKDGNGTEFKTFVIFKTQ